MADTTSIAVAFLHWPMGDDKDFFKRLIREAGGGDAREVQLDEKPDVVIASLFADRPAFDKWREQHPDTPLIFWFGENTRYPNRRHRSYDDYCLGQADLVLGYKRQHLGRKDYARLPYWLVSRLDYFDEVGKPLAERFRDAARLRETIKKTRFASLIARHDSSGFRGWLLLLLSHIAPVHCPSAAYKNVSDPQDALGEGWDAKRKYAASCLFSICPENSLGDGYTTEKPFDALLAGAWPVYFGEQPCEPDILRQECIIFADPDNVPATVKRLTECLDRMPPTIGEAIVPGGEQAIDRMIEDAVGKVRAVVEKARRQKAAAAKKASGSASASPCGLGPAATPRAQRVPMEALEEGGCVGGAAVSDGGCSRAER
jgi:hypothetical protein